MTSVHHFKCIPFSLIVLGGRVNKPKLALNQWPAGLALGERSGYWVSYLPHQSKRPLCWFHKQQWPLKPHEAWRIRRRKIWAVGVTVVKYWGQDFVCVCVCLCVLCVFVCVSNVTSVSYEMRTHMCVFEWGVFTCVCEPIKKQEWKATVLSLCIERNNSNICIHPEALYAHATRRKTCRNHAGHTACSSQITSTAATMATPHLSAEQSHLAGLSLRQWAGCNGLR